MFSFSLELLSLFRDCLGSIYQTGVWRLSRHLLPIGDFFPNPNNSADEHFSTGLTGKYNFTLYYDVQLPGAPAAAVADNPT
jgi:hypothetical protein